MEKTLPSPQNPGHHLHWGNIFEGSLSHALVEAAKKTEGMMVVVTNDTHTAHRLEEECGFFAPPDLPIFHLADWETLPYDSFSPHHDIISQRLKTLYQLPQCKKGILLVPTTSLMHPLPPVSYVRDESLLLKKGDEFHISQARQTFEQRGYYCVSQVMGHGEFAVRGSIFDIYPTGAPLPYRIDLLGDEIESLRLFDPNSQRTVSSVEAIELLPAREYPLNEKSIQCFRDAWREMFPGNPLECPLYQDISAGRNHPGVEYYLPLFFKKTATLFDYLPPNSLLVTLNSFQTPAEEFWREVKNSYAKRSMDPRRPLIPPEKLFLKPDELFHHYKTYAHLSLHGSPLTEDAFHFNGSYKALPPITMDHKLENPLSSLIAFIEAQKGSILFCAESPGRKEILLELLQKRGLNPISLSHWKAFEETKLPLAITVAPLYEGFIHEEKKIVLITESALFGEHVLKTRRRKALQQDPDAILKNLAELSMGAPVVHIEHGVGRFVGLQRLEIAGVDGEYLTLEYANEDKLYVPVASLHLISRYSGVDSEHAPLHALGHSKWDAAKQKAAEKAQDVAAELLDIYARRAARKGFAFNKAEEEYTAFSNAFGFSETLDQENAILDVLNDMVSDKPMDRLICGDVGFGKTEVAMRAAFIAVQNNKQVAVLVPTTLLAQQHYETFSDRFADWPVKIEVLSRFKTKEEQTHIIEKLNQGKIDILIGTHKLLQSNIRFSNLGLLVVDEEHRFGVQQKEHLKSLRSDVDILTLTATPIPRTLNMSVAGMRDLSVIATPPEKRLSIKTFVVEKDKTILRDAIMRELLRGGQIFFLHNEVSTIEAMAEEIRTLVPEARVGVGHGQLHERTLEKIMYDFYHQRFNVLVCTTIIETGIDIPSANTILIHHADRFGLAQLHQLRGRVGRSHHQAYAYLLIRDKKALTPDALKRLEAISVLEDLGIGFTLATHDLEIRGAGEFLGQEQSGNIQAVGFSLYNELLERAVKALKSGNPVDLTKPFEKEIEIDMALPALIPEDYLPDVQDRLQWYKRFSNGKTLEELEELQVEMVDRYGSLPLQTQYLLKITQLKLLGIPLGVQKIETHSQGGRILFKQKTSVSPQVILKLLQDKSQIYQLAGPSALKFKIPLPEAKMRLQFMEDLLKKLASSDTPLSSQNPIK